MKPLPESLRHPAGPEATALLAARLGYPDATVRWVRETREGLPALVRGGGPAVLTCYHPEPSLLLVLGPAGLLGVPLLDREGRVRRVAVEDVVGALRAGMDQARAGPIEALLDEAGLQGRRRERARERLLSEQLRGAPLGGIGLLTVPPEAPLMALAREQRLFGPLFGALAARALATVVGVGGWWLIGAGAAGGRIAEGWIWGWVLLLMTGLLVERLGALAQGWLALRSSTTLKQLLLHGAMRTDPERFRADGVGGVLARVQESQALEDLVLTGGLGALLAVVDLLVAGWILSKAPGGLALVALLGLCFVGLMLGVARLRRLQRRWTEGRRLLTHRLVEDMVGHRTRLSQAEPARLHAGEDEALREHHARSVALDRHRVALDALLNGAFLLPALLYVGAQFTLSPPGLGGMALALGGVLWARDALGSIAASLSGLVSASISWEEVGELVLAARRAPEPGQGKGTAEAVAGGEVVLRARGLGFGWPGRRRVLQGVDVALRAGDRVLLTGASGGGKSTLVALFSGQRLADEGVLLLGGLDRRSLGEQRWRRRVVVAPQFHENHVFENSLAFNLLLGREWPASPEEQDEARALCEALDLGDLIRRMPAGLGQPVGASGWQMSHGERSRVFLARALLQGAEVVVLDESFAALDPITLRRCLAVAEARAGTLVVVAHL